MRKTVLIIAMAFWTLSVQAQRYISEIFTSVTKTSNIEYATNYSFLDPANPFLDTLRMDVYEPGGVDPLPQRPLVIVIHTGSFLPPYYNGQPTGLKSDSNVVETCMQFARRGYVAAAIDYRLGWNPLAIGGGPFEDIRRGSLLQAVYRAFQDTKASVRFFKHDQANANTFRVDSSAIILSGFGSGGYVALAYATIDKVSEISLPKFLANNTVGAPYNFMPGVPYVLQSELGDFEGYGGNPGKNNPNNTPGHTSDVHFVMNMGGAMGDSIWLEPGDVPMVAFHVVGDPFAPYKYGPVIVPTTGEYVVHTSGSYEVIRLATMMGNLTYYDTLTCMDPYTLKANTMNDGYDGLYPFNMNPPVQAGPWEWFDSTATKNVCLFLGFSNGYCDSLWFNTLLTNPDVSKAKAMAYIDTIMNYANPRIALTCLTVGIHETGASPRLTVVPNPATDQVLVSWPDGLIESVALLNSSGQEVYRADVRRNEHEIDCRQLARGLYFISATTEEGTAISRVLLE